MARLSKEFVKLETRLIDDYRFWTLSELDQLFFLKFLAISRKTNNQIPKNRTVIKGLLRTERSEPEIESVINRLKENFPKLKENKYFYYFDGYENRFGNYVPKKHRNGEPDEDEDEDEDKDVISTFNSLWNMYPRRDGKKKAFASYRSSLKAGSAPSEIEKAVLNYIDYIKDNKTEPQYIKMGSTFFNNWEDWVEYEPKSKPKTNADYPAFR